MRTLSTREDAEEKEEDGAAAAAAGADNADGVDNGVDGGGELGDEERAFLDSIAEEFNKAGAVGSSQGSFEWQASDVLDIWSFGPGWCMDIGILDLLRRLRECFEPGQVIVFLGDIRRTICTVSPSSSPLWLAPTPRPLRPEPTPEPSPQPQSKHVLVRGRGL